MRWIGATRETSGDQANPARAVGARVTGMGETRDVAYAQNMQQLIQLRWIAVIGQVATIMLVHHGLGIALPVTAMLLIVAGLALFNLACRLYWHRHREAADAALVTGLLVDVVSLTAQLYLSGGIGNPFVFLYLLQVVLAAVLLRASLSWVVVLATTLSVIVLAMVPGPVTILSQPGDGLRDPWVLGLLICFVLNAVLLVVFVTRINAIARARDARLAALRQRAVEEEHIVRMGLLASGAAHELGTPLSTLAVILGDWQHLPHFASDPELLADVVEMQAQVLRCKAIVTGILLSAGETRGEAPIVTSVHTFLDELVAAWRDSRPVRGFEYRNDFGDDVAIISDAGLAQMIGNVLDNALEASPDGLTLTVTREGDDLCVRVADAGPGFSDAMLAHLGQPYQSSKGRPGGGLGLFLSLNVARTLGGTLTARNGDEGGAIVTMTLPLAPLLLDHPDADHDD